MTDVKIVKRKTDILCFTFKKDNILFFGKLFYIDNNDKLKEEYNREVKINKYILENIEDLSYYTKLLEIYENILPFDFILKFVKDKNLLCNILIFEHSGFHTLRYYINRLSSKNFNNILEDLKKATKYLEDINVIHYDLYCESNIMLKKINNKWVIKIIDYGLAYIDETDKSNYDYNIALDSIKIYNKKHIISL